MTEQLVFHHRYDGEKETGLSWPRIVGIAFWLWIGIGEGQRGDNRFGPNPKGQ